MLLKIMITVRTKFTNHKYPRVRKDSKDPNTLSAKNPTPSIMTLHRN